MFREEYCENIDGRLGHVCTTTIVIDGQLQVDHIDGNPGNNDRLLISGIRFFWNRFPCPQK